MKKKIYFSLFFLLFVFLASLSFYLRIDDYFIIKNNQFLRQSLFLNSKEPLLQSVDGYLYLRYSKELLENAYFDNDLKDELRHFPYGAKKPSIPPLISSLNAFLSLVFHSIFKSSCFFSPIMSIINFFVFFFLAREFSKKNFEALISAFLASVGVNVYFYRTSFGFFDTDALNVFFVSLIVFESYRYVKYQKKIDLFFLIVFSILFIVEYDQARWFSLFFSLYFVFLSLILRRQYRLVVLFLAVALGLSFFIVDETKVISTIKYIIGSESAKSIWPLHKINVAEQRSITSLSLLLKKAFSNSKLLFLSFLISISLFVKNRIQSKDLNSLLIIFPLIVLVGLSFKAIRFLIYLSPLMSISFTSLFSYELRLIKLSKLNLSKVLPIVVSAILIFVVVSEKTGRAIEPKVLSYDAYSFLRTKKKTEENSAIFSYWDRSYVVQLFADRKTFFDGEFHSSIETYLNSIVYGSDDFEFTSNLIRLYSRKGREIFSIFSFLKERPQLMMNCFRYCVRTLRQLNENEISDVCSISTEEAQLIKQKLLSIMNQELKTKIYVLFDRSLSSKVEWTLYFSNYDFETKRSKVDPYYHWSILDQKIYSIRKPKIDSKNFLVTIYFPDRKRTVSVKEIKIIENDGRIRVLENKNSSSKLILIVKKNEVVITTHRGEKTLFHRAFVLNEKQINDFILIDRVPSLYALYELKNP